MDLSTHAFSIRESEDNPTSCFLDLWQILSLLLRHRFFSRRFTDARTGELGD